MVNPVWWRWFPWILALIIIGTTKLLWIQNYGFKLPTDLYVLFPYLGILAFSFMWTHYAIAEVRRINPKLPKNELYSKVTGILVFILILSHPGLLALAQYQNGAGLPPGSAYAYVGKMGASAVTLGIIAWFLFLSYDVFDRIKNRPFVKNNWWLVNITQSVAMLLILKHSFELGSDIQSGWFKTYWTVLGTLLLPLIIHTHWDDWKKRAA